VNKKYHDKFNWSIMMDPEHTKVRNEAMRRIKMYKMKETHLPNFMRKKREEMLGQRGSSLDQSQLDSHP
jgi:hypothetical protein